MLNYDSTNGDVSVLSPKQNSEDTNLNFSFSSERVGAGLTLRLNEFGGNTIDDGTADTFYIWFKPIDIVKVTAGGVGVGLSGGNWQTILEANHTKGLQVDVETNGITFAVGAGSDWGRNDYNNYFANASNQEANKGSAWLKASYAIDGVGTVSVAGIYNAKNNWINDKTAYGKSDLTGVYHIGFGAEFAGSVADAGLSYFVDAVGFVGDKKGSGLIDRKDELGFNAVAFLADAKYEANGLSAEVYVPGQINVYEDVDDDDKVLVGTAVKLAYSLGNVTPYIEAYSANWLAKDNHLQVHVKPGVGGTFAGALNWDVAFDATITPDPAGDNKSLGFLVPLTFSVSF